MALSADEKFIYINPDTTAGEFNTAQFFPVKYLRGIECATTATIALYFRGPQDAFSTKVTVSITDGFVKQCFIDITDELNFGENAVITLVDRSTASSASTGGTDFQYVNAYVVPVIVSDANTASFADLQVSDDLDIGGDTVMSGSLTLDSVALSAVQTSAESFADNDTSVMTSAAIDDRINAASAAGWHGSTTRIKILASDFIPDDGGRPAFVDDTGAGSENFFLESFSSNILYATVAIPTGFTATHIMIHGSATDAIEVWEMQINSKTGVSKGTGNVDTEIDITDVESSATNYLLIQVANASGNEVHGGYVTIAAS
tara:strand:+ start:107 stop:1057 length:951 start_codon:yes stop_codon:yes gene_type:complete